ncbi:MAG: L-serine ammonia-lyase, iron-sulfur-dependent, subunit alpha, partial [Limnochordia bacterium]|nr:L-serine ammonia-lyase, iron-sulfur-dependent, subunit alpha [Limnochordia bacterium]
MNNTDIIALLRKEMVQALGVTEPAAIALACSSAYAGVTGDIETIELGMDPGMFKNAFSCAVPGTGDMGIEIAALLGVLGGNPDLGLEVLRDITKAQICKAKELRDREVVKVQVEYGLCEADLHLEALVHTTKGTGKAVISGAHANIVRTEVNGRVTFEKLDADRQDEAFDITQYKVEDFVGFVENVSFSQIEFLLRAIEVNRELIQAGLGGAGMRLGQGMQSLVVAGAIGDDLRSYAEIRTACAVDARMGGLPLPAMSICGSGDHGIIATVPLLAIAERKKLGEER